MESARPVVTAEIMKADHQVIITAMGTVRPAGHVPVRAQVGGEIVYINENLVVGGKFHEDEEMLKIDPANYELPGKHLQVPTDYSNHIYDVRRIGSDGFRDEEEYQFPRR
jgi:hypothetical protein